MRWWVLLWVGLFVAARAFGDAVPSRGRSLCERSPRECEWAQRSPAAPEENQPRPAPTPSEKPSPKPEPPVLQPRHRALGTVQRQKAEIGNLPRYFMGAGGSSGEPDGDFVLVAEKPVGASLPGLHAGDILKGELQQSLKVSTGVPVPIRVKVTHGRFRGSWAMGTASLDRELKRVLISLDRFRPFSGGTIYSFKATGLAGNGQLGLEGEFHSQELKYFAVETLAAAAAGFADATTQRTQNALGNFQSEPSVGNAAKQGAVSGLSKSADRFAEQGRSAPEYTEIEGGRELQILVQENATEAIF